MEVVVIRERVADEVVTDCVRDSGSAIGVVYYSISNSGVHVWGCVESVLEEIRKECYEDTCGK